MPGRVDLDSRLFLRKHPSSEWFCVKEERDHWNPLKILCIFWNGFWSLEKNGPAGLRILIHCTVVICFLGDTVDIYKYQKCWSMPGLGCWVFVLVGFFQQWDSLFLLLRKLQISDISIRNYCPVELLWIFCLPSKLFKLCLISSKEKKVTTINVLITFPIFLKVIKTLLAWVHTVVAYKSCVDP